MKTESKAVMAPSAEIIRGSQQILMPIMATLYHVECLRPDGTLRWAEDFRNLVVNAGLDDLLDKYFKGSAYTAAHYVGLVNGATSPLPAYAAGDTMASHAGWTENQNYSEANRQTLTLGTVSGQSVDNSASKASFSINASVTIAGCFVADNNTKGGTSGVLYGVGNFTGGDKAADNGDTINVTVTLTSAAA